MFEKIAELPEGNFWADTDVCAPDDLYNYLKKDYYVSGSCTIKLPNMEVDEMSFDLGINQLTVPMSYIPAGLPNLTSVLVSYGHILKKDSLDLFEFKLYRGERGFYKVKADPVVKSGDFHCEYKEV